MYSHATWMYYNIQASFMSLVICPLCIFTVYSWNTKIILFTNGDYEHLGKLYKIECNRIGCLFSPLKVKVTQLCPTLCDPMDTGPEYWSG